MVRNRLYSGDLEWERVGDAFLATHPHLRNTLLNRPNDRPEVLEGFEEDDGFRSFQLPHGRLQLRLQSSNRTGARGECGYPAGPPRGHQQSRYGEVSCRIAK